jgi:predicted RNase H-like nuclease (RuvC/YqgF family)
MSDPVDTYEPLVHEVSATVRMGANPNGSWVKVSDYDAAIRRAEEAEKLASHWDHEYVKARQYNRNLENRIADLESKLAEAERDLRLCKGHDIVSKFRMLAAERDDLLDKLIAERTRREALEAALRKYGHHLAECDYIVDMLPCSCGMEGIRAALSSGKTEEDKG